MWLESKFYGKEWPRMSLKVGGWWQTLKVSLHTWRNLSTLLLSLMKGKDSQSDWSDRFCFGLERSADCETVDYNRQGSYRWEVAGRHPFQGSLWKVTCGHGTGRKSQDNLGRICWPAGPQQWYMEKSQGVTIWAVTSLARIWECHFNRMDSYKIDHAWGWCTGTTQGDGMGRGEGGRFGMGSACVLVADSFWCLAKLIQLCRV